MDKERDTAAEREWLAWDNGPIQRVRDLGINPAVFARACDIPFNLINRIFAVESNAELANVMHDLTEAQLHRLQEMFSLLHADTFTGTTPAEWIRFTLSQLLVYNQLDISSVAKIAEVPAESLERFRNREYEALGNDEQLRLAHVVSRFFFALNRRDSPAGMQLYVANLTNPYIKLSKPFSADISYLINETD
ncbi:MAG: hypothetical protein LBN97_02170 [Oscillospiraceae bacterium]|jgi:hypothetical protein|nr:hypothetical protein [Oscillospiraceae bacterium]